MDTRTLKAFWVVCSVAFAAAVCAQEAHRFDLSLVSPDFPDFDSNPVLDGDEGQEFLFTAEMVISSAGASGGDGVQGWSCSLEHFGLEVVSLTTEGTVSAPFPACGTSAVPSPFDCPVGSVSACR